jgi:hypothetical protein
VTPDPTPGARWFQTRRTDLVAETLSDETLVIDTASGVFFSLRGVASGVWSLLEHTASDAELRAAVRDHFADASGTDVDVDAYVAALQGEGLAVETDAPRDRDATAAVAWPGTYEPPQVKKYDDMADLLLVDPIHDVAAERGWPDRRPESP